jgi:hypothetical protein
MTEYKTPREIRETIKAQLGRAPLSVDHNGVSREEYDARRDAIAATLEATEPPAQPQQVGMKPNPAQGHGGTPAPTQHTGTPLERIRAKALAAADALFDNGGAR